MTKSLLNKLTYFIGGTLIFATGMLYILLTDIYLPVKSAWLLIASIFSIGSAVCMLLSTNVQDERVKFIVMKSIAVALAIGFIVVVSLYLNTALTSTLKSNSTEYKNGIFTLVGIFKDSDRIRTIVMTVISIVLGSIALILQSTNLVLTILDKTDD